LDEMRIKNRMGISSGRGRF